MPYLVCEGNEDYEPGESPICHNSMCYLGLCTSIVDHMQYMGEQAQAFVLCCTAMTPCLQGRASASCWPQLLMLCAGAPMFHANTADH